jgi:DNA mismatch endonuclease (patch repair protein)
VRNEGFGHAIALPTFVRHRPRFKADVASEAASITRDVAAAVVECTPVLENEIMTDIISPEDRSALMGRIRGTDTGPELLVRRLLHKLGYRYRLHQRKLPGRPDIVFRAKRAVIFVHGCFWHRHDCGLAYVPKSRSEFWRTKFARNTERDRENQQKLAAEGWKILVVWECELDSPKLERRLTRFLGPVRHYKIVTGSRTLRARHRATSRRISPPADLLISSR